MTRIWIETADPNRHIDYMFDWIVGGRPVQRATDNLLRRRVLLIRVCGFTFQFHSRQQLEEAIELFSLAIRPSTRLPDVTLEHYWHPWSQRLPKGFTSRSKRLRILAALQQASASRAVGQQFA